MDHVKNGGSINDFIQLEQEDPDYASVDIENEQFQKYLLEDLLTEQGFSPEKIQSKIDKYEEAGLLKEEAETAKEKLVELQKKKREDLLKTQKLENDKKISDAKTRTENIKNKILGAKEIAGFPLTQGEQNNLVDYMMKPVKEGKTQLQLDYDDEAQLKMAYFLMKKFDFSTVQKKATTKATIKLKEAVSRVNDPNLKPKGSVVTREEKEEESSSKIYGLPWQKK
jgi:DNA-binding transcriptional MerR regulator